jgi:hypothetical protein
MGKSIKLKDYVGVMNEAVAAGTITPGMLLELTNAGKVQAHSVEGGDVMPMIAFENELEGQGTTDNYSADDIVQVWIPQRGDEAIMILATSQVIVVGDLLSSKGNGHVKKHVPMDVTDVYGTSTDKVYGKQIVGVALEAITTTATAAQIKVRIM